MPTLLAPLITDAGLAAAINAAANGLQLAITHVALGTGQYTPTVDQTNMTGRKEKVTIAGGLVSGTGAFKLNVMFNAWTGVPNPYSATELGFWAGDPDAGGILFAVYSHPSNTIVVRNALDYIASFGLQLSRVPAGSVTVEVDPDGAASLALMAAHEGAVNPHPQYALKTELPDLLPDQGAVRKPSMVSPTAGSTLAGLSPLLQGSNYYSLYGVAQGGAQFQVSASNTFPTTLYDSGTIIGETTSKQMPNGLLVASTQYYCRCRYKDAEGVWSTWSNASGFITGAQTVNTPNITSPLNAATNIGDGVTVVSSAFSMSSGSDTHGLSDWEVWTGANGTGTLVYASYEDVTNKTSIPVPAGTFNVSTTYHVRVRYAGVSSGYSNWSASISFTTAAAFGGGGPVTGGAYGGGYLAGYIMVGAQKYALIAAPRATGEMRDLRISTLSTNLATSRSVNDGKANTDAQYAAGADKYPAAAWAKGLTIGGYADWYIPSRDENDILYRAFKPDNNNNRTGGRYDGGQYGENANSVPVGTAYTNAVPAKTTIAIFQDNSEESFGEARNRYHSSTYTASGSQVVTHKFDGAGPGDQNPEGANNDRPVRAMRRIPVAS